MQTILAAAGPFSHLRHIFVAWLIEVRVTGGRMDIDISLCFTLIFYLGFSQLFFFKDLRPFSPEARLPGIFILEAPT